MTQEKRKAEQELASFKKDLEELEGSMKKVDAEKTNKDHTIRNLNDQIAQQDETINKLNREKKRLQVGTGHGETGRERIYYELESGMGNGSGRPVNMQRGLKGQRSATEALENGTKRSMSRK